MSLETDRYRVALDAEVTALPAALRDADLALRVPTCPDWTLAELTGHLGGVHRWVATIIERRAAEYVRLEDVDDLAVPSTAANCDAWLAAGVVRLLAAIDEAGPRTPVWSWSDDRSVGFWLRRMLHETVVHRADVAITVGHPVEIAPDIAADGISEWLGFLSSEPVTARPEVAGLPGAGQTLHFHATDGDLGLLGEWMVRRTPDGVRWEHGHGKGDVAVRGSAADLHLVLQRRLPPARVQVLGDAELLEHWVANTRW